MPIRRIGRKVRGTVAKIISQPAVARSRAQARRFSQEASILKEARATKGHDFFTKSGKPTRALKIHTAAEAIRSRRTKKRKK